MAVWKCGKCGFEKEGGANHKAAHSVRKRAPLLKMKKGARKSDHKPAELVSKAREYGPLTVSVAAAADEEVLLAIKEARNKGLPLLSWLGLNSKFESWRQRLILI